jgi:hypothetical protein
LGESEDFAVDKFLNAFATKPDSKMPLRAQLAMDEVLSKVRREDWCGSKPRAAMLKAWAAGQVEDDDGSRIIMSITHAFEREDLGIELACEVFRLAINNKDWPLRTRKFGAAMLGELGRGAEDRVTVERLVQVVLNLTDKDLRSAAGVAIRRHIKLDEMHETALRDAEDKGK